MRALLGIDENGDYRLFISAFTLSTISPMHGRGKPFSSAICKISDKDQTVTDEEAIKALNDCHRYFTEYEKSLNKRKKA